MIDFTNSTEIINNFKGSEKKKTLIYNNKKYLVKFPDPIREKNKNISYINNAISEYIGSNIFKISGINTQNTIIGKYNYNGKEKTVCACEDFTNNVDILCEFENLVLSYNPDKRIETELSDIMEIINENILLNKENIKEKFWDMFVIDSLIGNTDRHNGNWGFLISTQTGNATFSPIYDCGSCLNPTLEDKDIEKFNESELKNIILNCYSCLKINGKKINYMSFINQKENIDCNNAIIRMFPKINLNEIKEFITNIECISKIRKEFYIKIIEERYNIIKNAYLKLIK